MSTTEVVTELHASVHPKSQAGFGVGKAELYDVNRTSYPPEVLSYIRKTLNGKEELSIVEIASGSGKFTRPLLSHAEWNNSVAEMKCIEPNEGMRIVFSRTVNDPRVGLSDGTFDNTGVVGGWADFIVVATAFHWCLQHEAAAEEFMRILKPDGVVCFLWNPDDRAAWLGQVYDMLLPKHSGYTAKGSDFYKWRQFFELPVYKENFMPPKETIIEYTEADTLETFTARCMTRSGIAILPDDEKEDIKRQIKEIVERGDELVWMNQNQGIFEVPFASPIVIFRRKSEIGRDETKQT